MKSLGWTLLAFVMLLFWPGRGQTAHSYIVIRGKLQIFDGMKPICKSVPDRSASVWAEIPEQSPVSLERFTNELDSDCQWVLTGSLDEPQRASIILDPKYLDFVPERRRTVNIDPATVNEHRVIPACCYGLVLWSKSRARAEYYSLGNKKLKEIGEQDLAALDPATIDPILERFNQALSYERHPAVLQSKADLLEKSGRVDEAVESLRELAQIENEAFKSSRQVQLAPSRIVELTATQARRQETSWQSVSDEAKSWLSQGVDEGRAGILALYMDSIFARTSPNGDYKETAQRIMQNNEVRRDWNDLYFTRFKKQGIPSSVSESEVRLGIHELQSALGRETN